MIAGLSRTRRLEFRDGWARVKRLGFALAALVAVGVPGAAAAAAHTIALFRGHTPCDCHEPRVESAVRIVFSRFRSVLPLHHFL